MSLVRTRESMRPFVGAHLGSMPLDTEEGRALLQERIALFGEVAFFLSLLFLVVVNVVSAFVEPEFTLQTAISHVPNWVHAAGALASFFVWMGCGASIRSSSALMGLDVAATLIPLACYGVMGALQAQAFPDRIDLVMSLITMLVITSRAVIVPSTPRQAFLVSAMGSLPAMVIAIVTSRTLAGAPEDAPIWIPVYNALWCICTITVAVLASRIIYGLRTQAAHAVRLGQYLLDDKIGEGGMGTVYRARHALLRRPTAVKLLRPDRVGTETLARFEREVQHTSMLTHPNTVAIYDYGRTPDGLFYYAMELLDGIDLQELVESNGAQEPARVVHILGQVCGSLSEAHAASLVHRDIKPANIILCDRGGVADVAKVVDFGLVKDVTTTESDRPDLSNVNTIIGTPAYMAPEAFTTPDKIDARSDVYSLGAVGYYLLTGHAVFESESLIQIAAQHLHDRPAPLSKRAQRTIPVALEQVILQCLEKDPAARPQSADLLRKGLENANAGTWTREQARQWWSSHPRMQAGQGVKPRSLGSPVTVTIDMSRRVAGR